MTTPGVCRSRLINSACCCFRRFQSDPADVEHSPGVLRLRAPLPIRGHCGCRPRVIILGRRKHRRRTHRRRRSSRPCSCMRVALDKRWIPQSCCKGHFKPQCASSSLMIACRKMADGKHVVSGAAQRTLPNWIAAAQRAPGPDCPGWCSSVRCSHPRGGSSGVDGRVPRNSTLPSRTNPMP